MAPLIYPPTLLDPDQVIQYVYDEATQTLRTTATAVIIGQPIEVEIDMATDSIRLGDGLNFFTSTTIGPKVGLDVNLINSVLPVVGTVQVSNFPTTVNTNYGIVSNDTIRTASEIGNATGAADFDGGLTTAQTLRVVLPTDQTPIPITGSITIDPDVNIHDSTGNGLNSTAGALDSFITNASISVTQGTTPWVVSGTVDSGNDTNYGVVGANTLRTAAQIGNATGASDFDAGITTAQTLRVVLPTDQSTIPVDASQAGVWNINDVTGTISLPTGASTSANQINGSQKTQVIDGSGNVWGPRTNIGGPVNYMPIINLEAASNGATVAGRTLQVGGSDGTNLRTFSTDTLGYLNTNAFQGTSPWVVSGSVTTSPNVNIHDAAGNNLTSQVNGAQRALDVGINVAGVQIDPRSIRALTSSDTITVVQPTGTSLHTVIDSGTVSVTQSTSPWVVSGTVAATQSGAWTTGRTWTLASGTDSIASVQSGTWNIGTLTSITNPVTVNQGTSPWVVSGTVISNEDKNYGTVGANTLRTAAQIGNATGAALFGAGTTTAQVLRVVLPTDQTAIPVSQSGAWAVSATQGTSPWVVSGTVTANAGTGNFTVIQPTGTNLHVVVDSGTLAVTQSGTWNINNITGTVSLPTGAATSALQTTGNASLSSIDSKTPTLGQAVMAASVPVVIASNQSVVPVSGTVAATQSGAWNITNITGTVSLPTNAATETTLVKLPLTQGSTTSGQSGVLELGAVTTAAPTYITGQSSPLSLTTSGALRTDSSGSTQPISGTVIANAGIGTFTTQDTSSLVDNSVFTDNSSRVLPVGFVYDDVAGTPLTENDIAAARVDSKRAQISVIEDGTVRGQKAAVSAAGALSQNLVQVGGTSLTLGQKASSASIPVVFSSDQPFIPDVIPTPQTITVLDTVTSSIAGANGQVFYLGTPSAGSAASFTISSVENVTIEAGLSGFGTGTMVVEVSMDGGTIWIRPNVYQISTQSYTNLFTNAFIAVVNTVGMTNLRVRSTVSWSGTSTIRIVESSNTRNVTIGDALPAGANTIGSISNISGSISLPNGASTATNQTTIITSLQLIDDAINAPNTAVNKGVPIMGQLDDTGTVVATEDNVSIGRITAQRALHTNLRNNAGVEIATAANPLRTQLPDNLVTTGTIVALNGTVVADGALAPYTTFLATMNGTWNVGTSIVMEGSLDNITWQTIYGIQTSSSTSTPNNGISGGFGIQSLRGLISGFRYVRTRANTFQVADSVTVQITLTTANGSSVLNSSLPAGTNSIGTVKAQLQDNAGTAIILDNGQLLVQDSLGTAGQYRAQSVTTTATEALGAASILVNRKILGITPTNGTIYWGFSNTVTTATGTPIFQNQTFTISATENIHIFIISATTLNARIFEGS